MAPARTEQQLADLEVARSLALVGVPIFVAERDPAGKGHNGTGFWLPAAWQQSAPDPAVVDRWQPGMALCAVMGTGLDLLDVDPRNGGELGALNGAVPASYGVALTPSGGMHSFIRSIGVGSRDGAWPGIDFKGGELDGSGRGFAFLAPTERISKTTGELTAYRWAQQPDVERLRAALADPGLDTSGVSLAARVRELRADGGVSRVGGPDWWRAFVTAREPQSAPAAEKAIGEKLTEVAAWRPESGANFRTTLMTAAFTLGGYVGGGYLAESDAWARLEAMCAQVWGAPDEDDRRWIEQGLTDGAVQPFHVYTAEDEALYGEAAQAVAATRTAPAWSPYRALGTEPFDPQWCSYDQEFAEAVAQRTAPALRFAVDAGTWLVRDAEVWRERDDLSGWAVAMVARLAPLGQTPVPKDVAQRTPEHWQAVRRQRLMTSSGAGAIERKLRAIVRGGDHPSSIELAGLDGEPEVLWAGGMPWDLRASRDVPTPAALDPATPHLRTAACAPDARPTPHWDAFTSTIWPDPDMRAWALRVLAIALTGYADAALPMLYGPERTGKTSVVELLVRLLGTYGHAADPRLLGGADSTHASVVYALKGRRLSFIDEGPRRGHLATERLKQLTGGGQLTGNAMRANPVTWSPTHTIVMTTNDEPTLTDPALRARMRIIPCEADQTAVRAARQAITPAVWEVEAPGVLAAMMREAAAWLTDPASALPDAAPAAQRGLVDEMAAGQDPAREWRVSCTVATDAGTPGRELYLAFVKWFTEHPLYRRASVLTETAFGRSLTAQGFPPKKINGAWIRQLSVLGGPAGIMPWEPMPSPHMTPGSGGFVAGSGGFVAGSPSQPANGDNPMSTPVLPSALAGSAGLPTTSSRNEEILLHTGEHTAISEPNTGTTGNPPESTPKTSPDLGLAGSGGLPVKPATAPTDPSGHPGPVDQPKRTRRVTKAEVAARAYQGRTEKQISKAEARAQLKEEQRQQSIRDAQGEVLGLPAVVDRAGNVLPVDPDQAAAIVRTALTRSGALTVDVETSGYPVGHRHYALRSVQLGDAVAAVVLHPVEHADLIRALLDEAPVLHAHSAAADLVPLAHAGLIDAESGWARMYDTVIPAKLGDPRSTGSDPGLKQLAGAVLGAASVSPAADEGRLAVFKAGKWLIGKQRFADQLTTPLERNGWAQIETGSTAMLRYAASDVLDTAALPRALPAIPELILARERLAEEMTARVAHRGLRIDHERVRELTAEHTRQRDEAGARVEAFGVENPGSGPQIAEAMQRLGAVLPVSEKGNPSVAEHVLAVLKRTTPDTPAGQLAAAVLDYRHSATVLGLFLAPYTALCEQADGRMRPTVYTLGTDTGRMAAVRPNIQQLPREGGVRSVVTADPGYVLISADFSGVELRGAAALSQDPAMRRLIDEEDAFNTLIATRAHTDGVSEKEARTRILTERGWANGGTLDGFHWVVARQAFGPNATKSHRYVAKRGCFGTFYGGGAEGLAKQVGVPVGDMETIRGSLRAVAPDYFVWADQMRAAVRRGATQFESYAGRVIHLPADTPHKAPAYAIQGSCRELLVDALVRWRETRWGSCTLLPVHDELIVMVPEEDAEEATADLARCMEGSLYGVRIVAEPSAPSFAWQDAT